MKKRLPYYTRMDEMNAAVRTAQINGTRQMMHEDEISALVGVLVDCKAIPREIMADALQRLANRLIEKARGELQSDWAIYPAEIFDRARSLSDQAARLRTSAASVQ